MLKRLLAALCAAAMCAAMIGCTQTETAPQTQDPAPQGEPQTVTLYLPDDQAESVVPTKTELVVSAGQEPAALIDGLVEAGALPDGVAVNQFENDEETRALTLDLNATFAEALSGSGTAGETMLMAAVVDTFLAYYGASSLLVTVDGQTLESGHAVYDEPFTQIFAAAPAA